MKIHLNETNYNGNLGPLLILLEKNWLIGFNEGVWIWKSLMICKRYCISNIFLFKIQLHYQKMVLEGKNG
jgi:hypothetical protein